MDQIGVISLRLFRIVAVVAAGLSVPIPASVAQEPKGFNALIPVDVFAFRDGALDGDLLYGSGKIGPKCKVPFSLRYGGHEPTGARIYVDELLVSPGDGNVCHLYLAGGASVDSFSILLGFAKAVDSTAIRDRAIAVRSEEGPPVDGPPSVQWVILPELCGVGPDQVEFENRKPKRRKLIIASRNRAWKVCHDFANMASDAGRTVEAVAFFERALHFVEHAPTRILLLDKLITLKRFDDCANSAALGAQGRSVDETTKALFEFKRAQCLWKKARSEQGGTLETLVDDVSRYLHAIDAAHGAIVSATKRNRVELLTIQIDGILDAARLKHDGWDAEQIAGDPDLLIRWKKFCRDFREKSEHCKTATIVAIRAIQVEFQKMRRSGMK